LERSGARGVEDCRDRHEVARQIELAVAARIAATAFGVDAGEQLGADEKRDRDAGEMASWLTVQR
jgi:hypothetical protein